MRYFVIAIVILLSACNGSDTKKTTTQIDNDPTPTDNDSANDSAYVTTIQLQQQVSALQTQLAQIQASIPASQSTAIQALQARINKLQLIGRPINPIPRQFGPCEDMGVMEGRGGSDSGSPIDSQFETFKTCAGYTYSISSLTGLLDIPPYLTWDGPNCTGNVYLEMDVPQNTMNADAVKNGIVFQSPIDNTIVYEIPAGEQLQQIMIQSAINTRGGVCGPDQEVRLVVHAILNVTSITGVPNSMIPGSWTMTAP